MNTKVFILYILVQLFYSHRDVQEGLQPQLLDRSCPKLVLINPIAIVVCSS